MKNSIFKISFFVLLFFFSFNSKSQDLSLIFHDAIIVNDSVYGYCFVNKEYSKRYNKTIFKVGFSNSNFNGIKDEIEIDMKDGYNLSGIQIKEGRLLFSIYESVNTQVPFAKNEYERKIIVIDLIEKVIKSEKSIQQKINDETEWSLVGDSKILNFTSPLNSGLRSKKAIMTVYDQYLNEILEYKLSEDCSLKFSSFNEQNINSNNYLVYKINCREKLFDENPDKIEYLKFFSLRDNLILDKIGIKNESDSYYYNLEYIFEKNDLFYLYQEISVKTNKKTIRKSIGVNITKLERVGDKLIVRDEKKFLWDQFDKQMPEVNFDLNAQLKIQLWSGLSYPGIYSMREKSNRIVKAFQIEDDVAFVRKDLFRVNILKGSKLNNKVISDTISIIKIDKNLSKMSIDKINIDGNEGITKKEILTKEIIDFKCLYNPNEKKLNMFVRASGMLINILLDEKNILKSDIVNLDKKATINFVSPAKPGYIFLMDYYEKDKKITPRLEKLAY